MSDNKINERAIELFESQSPHQLAVTAATAESKSADIMSALDRMTDQRDQLTQQLKDATEQLAASKELLEGCMDILNGEMICPDVADEIEIHLFGAIRLYD